MRIVERILELVSRGWRWFERKVLGRIMPPPHRRRDKTPNPITNFTARYDDMSNARITWTWPTTRVEGEALPEAQIQHLELSMSADGGANFSGVAQVAPPSTEHVIADLAPGTYMFRGVVVDTQGRRSANAETTAGVLSDPNPVGDFTVVIE